MITCKVLGAYYGIKIMVEWNVELQQLCSLGVALVRKKIDRLDDKMFIQCLI